MKKVQKTARKSDSDGFFLVNQNKSSNFVPQNLLTVTKR